MKALSNAFVQGWKNDGKKPFSKHQNMVLGTKDPILLVIRFYDYFSVLWLFYFSWDFKIKCNFKKLNTLLWVYILCTSKTAVLYIPSLGT